MLAFTEIVLRALTLAGQSLALGGALVGLLVVRPWLVRDPALAGAVRPVLRLAGAGAALASVASLAALGLAFLALGVAPRALPTAALGTAFGVAVLARALVGAGVLALVPGVARRPRSAARWASLALVAAALAASAAWTSHAAARLPGSRPLLVLGALHVVAAGAWIGGLVHLLVLARARGATPWPPAALRTFSRTAMVSVVLVLGGGAAMAAVYVGGARAAIGTAYGAMVVAKAVVTAGLLGLGLVSLRTVRCFCRGGTAPARLGAIVEAEAFVGLALLALAASLGAAPPAVDVVADRASPEEVAVRFTPRWPHLTTPTIGELDAASGAAPRFARTREDRLWSEYNHNVAGLVVLAMGLLAILERWPGARWARHWPLLLPALAVFLLLRSDPEVVSGRAGLVSSLADSKVLQHRLLSLLPAVFGLFEWGVRTGRVRRPAWRFVFPSLTIAGAVLLLGHVHTLVDVKEAFLEEITHLPLAVLGLVLGVGRWLELRLPPREAGLAARVWPFALALFGLLLVLYRES